MDGSDTFGLHPEEVTLLDYVVGDLAPDSSDAIRQHVETCSDCRDRIVGLAMEMDAIDQLPTVAIPHDILRGVFPRGYPQTVRPRRSRLLPFLLLFVLATGIVVLFRLGEINPGDGAVQTQRQVIVQTNTPNPEQFVKQVLGSVAYTLTVDRDDPRHLVVLVSDADLVRAYGQLSAASTEGGRSYIVDLGGTGLLPGSNP